MQLGIETFTLGVEEEYQIVDPATRALAPRQQRVLPEAEEALGDDVQPELQLSMIEIATPVCKTLRRRPRRARATARTGVIDAAKSNGSRIAAAGTHPFSRWSDQPITPKPRYREIARDFGELARETVIFGCHVHVGIPEREVAIGVLNRVRARLSPLLALGRELARSGWATDTQYAQLPNRGLVALAALGPAAAVRLEGRVRRDDRRPDRRRHHRGRDEDLLGYPGCPRGSGSDGRVPRRRRVHDDRRSGDGGGVGARVSYARATSVPGVRSLPGRACLNCCAPRTGGAARHGLEGGVIDV